MNFKEVLAKLSLLPDAAKQASEISGAMRRNSRVKPTEKATTQKVGRPKQLPRWAAAMHLARYDTNAPKPETRSNDGTVPAAIEEISERGRRLTVTLDNMVASAQADTEDTLTRRALAEAGHKDDPNFVPRSTRMGDRYVPKPPPKDEVFS